MKQCPECGKNLAQISCIKCGCPDFRFEPTPKPEILKLVCIKCNTVKEYLHKKKKINIITKEV